MPLTPAEKVRSALPLALLFMRVVEGPTVRRPLMVRADVVLFSVICVTLEPTPPLMVVVPAPTPELVIVPVLLTDAVEKVNPPAALA